MRWLQRSRYSSLLESGRDLWDITRKYAAEDFEDQEL